RAVTDWDNEGVLWPELNTFESLMADKKDMGSVIFFREMQNERREDSTAIIKRAWIKEYDPATIRFDGHFKLVEVLLGCDPSIREKVENDYTGVALILKAGYDDGRGSVYFIENVWNEHLSLDARVRLLFDIGQARPKDARVSRVFIEGIAGFKDFVAE